MKQKPKASGLPFIGNTLSLIKDPLGFFIRMYKKHGSVYRIKTVREEITVIAGHEANQFLNRYAKDYLLSEKIWKDFLLETGVERALISLDGTEHFNIRRILMRGYSAAMLMGKERSTLDIERGVLDQAFEEGPQSVVPFFKDMIVYLLGHIITDVSPDKSLSKDIQLYLATQLNVLVVKLWPKRKLKNKDYLSAKKNVLDFAAAVLEQHRQEIETHAPNLITDVIHAQAEGKLDFTEKELTHAVVTPFSAGVDTAAKNCSYLLYALITNPDVLAKARAEMDNYFQADQVDVKNLKDCDVMYRTIQETLRRYPVTPMVYRTVGAPFEFDGYQFEVGESVIMAQAVSHFLDDVFKDPQKFDIDRFAPPRSEDKQLMALSPYGLGAHKCLGMKLNEVLTILVMGYLIHYTNFELVPSNYKLKIKTLPTPGPDNKFRVKFTKRNV